jgi:hypothetical protein
VAAYLRQLRLAAGLKVLALDVHRVVAVVGKVLQHLIEKERERRREKEREREREREGKRKRREREREIGRERERERGRCWRQANL